MPKAKSVVPPKYKPKASFSAAADGEKAKKVVPPKYKPKAFPKTAKKSALSMLRDQAAEILGGINSRHGSKDAERMRKVRDGMSQAEKEEMRKMDRERKAR